MSEIHLRRRHELGLPKAREAADKVAEELAESFELQCEWDGDCLRFSRSGITGTLTVSDDEVVLDAQLNMLLAAFKPRIEEHLQKDFDRYFT